MAHVAFICPPFLGHLNPMAALARTLGERGHATTLLGIADLGPVAARLGFAFRPVGAASHPAGSLPVLLHRLGRVNGPFGLGAVLRDVASMTDTLCHEAPAALRSLGADILICDGTEAAGVLVAAWCGLPVVTVANALPLNREPLVPPAFTGWPYDPSPWGRERNAGGHRVADRMMARHARVIAGWAQDWGLGPHRTIADCLSGWAQVTQMVPGLDFPRAALPEVVHGCGPLRHPGIAPPPIALPAPDGRPLVYATLGTLQGGRAQLFGLIAEAARRFDARLVLAHAGGLSDEAARTLPGHPAVHAYVPQAQVLAAADLAVVNGGLNTVLDALGCGVPPLVMPLAFEQAAIAARVKRSRAGDAVSRHGLTPGRLARRMEALLRDPAARVAAGRLRAEIAGAGGAGRAADVVEAVLATGRPVTRASLASAAPAALPARDRAA